MPIVEPITWLYTQFTCTVSPSNFCPLIYSWTYSIDKFFQSNLNSFDGVIVHHVTVGPFMGEYVEKPEF